MKILVKNTRVDTVVSTDQTSNVTMTGDVSEAQVNSEIELIQSHDLLEAVVKKTELAKHYSGGGQEASSIAGEKALRQLEKDLSVVPSKKANVITISYSSRSAQQSSAVLRALEELYLEHHLQVHRVSGTEDFFKSQATQYERRLAEAEVELTSFETKNHIISLPLQKELGLKRVMDSEIDLQATDTVGQEAARRVEKIKQQISSLDPRIVTQSRSLPHQYSIERMNTMLVELRHKRTQLLSRFQPDDRLVKEVDQQIADTAAALDQVTREQSVEQTSDINPLRQNLELELARAQTDWSAKQARRDSLSRQRQDNQKKLSTLESTSLKHAELERRVKELKENYQLFAKKRDETLVTAALDRQKISNVAIAETPSTPSLPSSPNRKLSLLLGLFLAAFLGLSGGIGVEFLRDTIHTPRELEQVSGYPVLATVPHRTLNPASNWNPLLLESKRTDGGRG